MVTEQEFRQFVDDEVTKRFPDGLTLLKGDGQFRGEDNITSKEQSFVLILLYPYETFKKSSQKMASLVTVSWGAQRSGDPDHDELRSTPDDATARTASVRRGIPTTLSTPALDPVLMYDGRQQNLDAQAQAAILDHAAATRKPSATELERIAEFERTRPFFSSRDLWKLAVTPSATAGRC